MSVFQTALAVFGVPIIHWRTFLTFEINDQRAVQKRSLSAPPKIFQTASEKVVRRTKKKKVKTRQRVNDDLVLTEAKQLAIQDKWQKLAEGCWEKNHVERLKRLISGTPQRRATLSLGALNKCTKSLGYNRTDVFLMFTRRVFRQADDKVEIWMTVDQMAEERYQELCQRAIRYERVFFIDVRRCGEPMLVPYKLLPMKIDALRRRITSTCGLPPRSVTVSLHHADGSGVIIQNTITEDLVSVGDTLIAIVS